MKLNLISCLIHRAYKISKLAKILTNSKYLVDMKSYDCLNLGIAYGYKWILIILNQKWDT